MRSARALRGRLARAGHAQSRPVATVLRQKPGSSKCLGEYAARSLGGSSPQCEPIGGGVAHTSHKSVTLWAENRGSAAYSHVRGVASVVHPLGQAHGLPVALLSVELWTNEVCLNLAVVQGPDTRALDNAYATEMEALSVAACAGETSLRPPQQPSEAMLDLALGLSDDVGTSYRPTARSAGGSGTEWRSQWHFSPSVPTAARRLEIRLTDQPNLITVRIRPQSSGNERAPR